MVLASASASVGWYAFSLYLTYVGLVLLVLASVRAAILSRRDKYGGAVPLRDSWLERMDRDFHSVGARIDRLDRNDHTSPPLRTPPGIS